MNLSILCHTGQGYLPYHLHRVVYANELDTLENIFQRVASEIKYNDGEKFTDFNIYAHGKSKREIELLQMSMRVGGFGILLGKELLNLSNLDYVNVLKGHFERITIYSCFVADTNSIYANTIGDGQRLCGEIAVRTNTEVIASSDMQTYTHENGIIDQGEWEGTVYRFSPIDGSSSIILRNK